MASVISVILIAAIPQSSSQSVTCFPGAGMCYCPAATSGTKCTLNCSAKDSCKDSIIHCRAGDPCQVNCFGEDSCAGNTIIDGAAASDVYIRCAGKDACKGNVMLNCGSGQCFIGCGHKDSCDEAQLNRNGAQSLSCQGYCPYAFPQPFQSPTPKPTSLPTDKPTDRPTDRPTTTKNPTPSPTSIPTPAPTQNPTPAPTNVPTPSPTTNPSASPTTAPSDDSTEISATNVALISNNAQPAQTVTTTDMNSVGLIIIALLSIGLCAVMLAIAWILKCRYDRAEKLKAFGHSNFSYPYKPNAFKSRDEKYEMEMERVASGSSMYNVADAQSSVALKSPQSLTHMSSKYIGSPKSVQIEVDSGNNIDNKSTVSDIDNGQNQIDNEVNNHERVYTLDGNIETGANDYNIFLKMLQKNKNKQGMQPMRPERPQPPVGLSPQNMNGRGRAYNMQSLPASYFPHNIGYAQPQQTHQRPQYMMPRPAFYVPVNSAAPQGPPQQSVLGVIKQNEQVIEEEEMQCLKEESSGEDEVKEDEMNETNGVFDDIDEDVENGWNPTVKISQVAMDDMDGTEDVKSELSDCTESTAWNTNR